VSIERRIERQTRSTQLNSPLSLGNRQFDVKEFSGKFCPI